MSVWDLLKIQPTNEIVHIKAAYAKELKNCRPDQNPEGFQVLHQAYKAALRFAHNNSANEADDNRQLQQLQGKSAISEQASISPKNEGEHSPLEQDHLELLNSEYGRHLEKVSRILASNNTRNELNEWRFLLQSELILDPQFNAQLGMFVLDNILRINTDFESQKRNKKRYSQPNSTVKGSTVRYLNDIFHWQGQIQTLRYFFGDDNTRKILNMLEGHDHRSDTQSAIKSVKGGKVSENKSRTVNHAEQYAEALDALEDLKKLTYWTHGIGIFGICVGIMAMMKGDKIDLPIFFAPIIIVLIMQIIGVTQKNKYILYSMWPVSILLMLSFPWGTFVGWRMTQCLYKGTKYFRYS